ncbi:MAG: alkaline phosphatase PhoX [Sporichthyaceae bacterium]
MDRRTFVRTTAAVGGGLAVGGSLWRAVAAPTSVPAMAPVAGVYGALGEADANGLRLPPGFTSRLVARSGQRVPGTDYTWHPAPDGGACFADGTGWIYVSNSEIEGSGGVGALRFAADGSIRDAYRILAGTNRNCAGGATPWGTWLSCEEVPRGYVFETYPGGTVAAIRRDALGRFNHEAAAVDPIRRCIYLTEDEGDGCFYRFVPAVWPLLDVGRLEVLCGQADTGTITWQSVPDPEAIDVPTRRQVSAAKHFDGGEGCVYGADSVWFTTKGDNRVWRLDAAREVLAVAYDDEMFDGSAPLVGPDNITRSQSGDLFVAEDKGRMEICVITPTGLVSSFVRLVGHAASELTGPAFSPDGRRLYFSSQRGRRGLDSDGHTFEVTGPFRDLTPQAAG